LAIVLFVLPYCVVVPPEHGGSSEASEPHDALHIAIAEVNEIQYWATLIFKHIANAETRATIEQICRECGYVLNFTSYTKLIRDSVAKSGYDQFLPSLCVLSNSVELHILEIEPQPGGDKTSALDWASEFTAADRLLFCAYRAGDRQVEVVEISGTDVTYKTRIHVRPYPDGLAT
jgi:hypothetical protein